MRRRPRRAAAIRLPAHRIGNQLVDHPVAVDEDGAGAPQRPARVKNCSSIRRSFARSGSPRSRSRNSSSRHGSHWALISRPVIPAASGPSRNATSSAASDAREAALAQLLLGALVVALTGGVGTGSKRLVVHPGRHEPGRNRVDLDLAARGEVLGQPDDRRLGRRVRVVARQRRGSTATRERHRASTGGPQTGQREPQREHRPDQVDGDRLDQVRRRQRRRARRSGRGSPRRSRARGARRRHRSRAAASLPGPRIGDIDGDSLVAAALEGVDGGFDRLAFLWPPRPRALLASRAPGSPRDRSRANRPSPGFGAPRNAHSIPPPSACDRRRGRSTRSAPARAPRGSARPAPPCDPTATGACCCAGIVDVSPTERRPGWDGEEVDPAQLDGLQPRLPKDLTQAPHGVAAIVADSCRPARRTAH